MIFSIEKTSAPYSKKKPCKKAKKTKDGFQIEINTLEELMELIKQEGQVIVSEGEIEIYDDYRE